MTSRQFSFLEFLTFSCKWCHEVFLLESPVDGCPHLCILKELLWSIVACDDELLVLEGNGTSLGLPGARILVGPYLKVVA